MPIVSAPDGVLLNYEEAGSGPPLVLHLGAGCDHELWRAAGYIDGLAPAFRCVLFDHRGHGLSGRPQGPQAHHIDRYVADVVAVLDHLELPDASFWGYSNGIDVGLKLAQEHPDRVRALIGSGTVDEAMTAAQLKQIAAAAVASHLECGWERMIARFDAQEHDAVPEWMKDRIRATDIDQLDDWLRALPDWNWSSRQALAEVAAPALFLVGELEDEADPMAEIAGLMPPHPWQDHP